MPPVDSAAVVAVDSAVAGFMAVVAEVVTGNLPFAAGAPMLV
jgi:hypothetical protein